MSWYWLFNPVFFFQLCSGIIYLFERPWTDVQSFYQLVLRSGLDLCFCVIFSSHLLFSRVCSPFCPVCHYLVIVFFGLSGFCLNGCLCSLSNVVDMSIFLQSLCYFLFYFDSVLFHVCCIQFCFPCLVFPDQFQLCTPVFPITLVMQSVFIAFVYPKGFVASYCLHTSVFPHGSPVWIYGFHLPLNCLPGLNKCLFSVL